MDVLGDVGQMDAHFSPFGDVLINTQDMCTVCAEHAIGLEIILGTTDVTLGLRRSNGSSFWSIWRLC
jgi:hypothetical protein